MQKLRIRYLMRLHGLTESQAHVIAALIWGGSAMMHELTAFLLTGLERLPKLHLSNPARKTCFKAIWRSFTDAERAAFIKAVSKGGK